MAVTSDQLLVNVSVNTEKATAALGEVVTGVKNLGKQFAKTSDDSEKASKALNDFGFTNVKVASILSNVERSAKMVGKALRVAFGDEFMKTAADQFEKLGAEIGSAINEGLQMDVGKELVEAIKGLTKAFRDIRPAVVETIATIASFFKAIKDGVMAVDWEPILKGIAALGAGLLIAFAPTVIAAIMSFAAGMAAALTPVIILAAKIVLITGAIAGLATAIEFIVKNFGKLGDMIVQGFGVAFEKSKEIIAEFAMWAIQKITNMIAAVSGAFPNMFGGVASEAVGKLSKMMEGLATSTINARDEGEKLQKKLVLTAKSLDTNLTAMKAFESLKGGVQEFSKSFSGAADSAQRTSYGVRQTADELERAKKAAAEMLEQQKAADALFKENARLAGEIAAFDSTINERINLRLRDQLLLVDAKEKELRLSGKMSEQAQVALDSQRELLKAQAEQQRSRAPSEGFETLAKGGADIARGISSVFTSGAMDFVGGLAGGVGAIVSAANAVLDMIPNMINNIAGIFNKITELPLVLASSIKNLAKSLTRFVSDAIPNLLKAVPDIIETIFVFIAEELPNALIGLLENLPDMIMGFVKKLPQMIDSFIDNLIKAIPALTEAIISFLIEDFPVLANAIQEMIIVKIPSAVIKGLFKWLDMIGKMFVNLFSGKGFKLPAIKIDTKQATAAIKSFGSAVTGEASKVFKVVDLEEQGAAMSDRASELAQAIEDGMKKSVDIFKMAWDDLLKDLKAAWDWIYANIIQPIFDGLRAVWLFVYEQIIMPIFDGIKAAWQFIYDTIIQPLIDGIKAAWTFVQEQIINPLIDGIKSAWSFVQEKIIQPMIDGLDKIWDGAKKVGDAIWKPIKEGFESVGNIVKDAFDAINPANLFGKIFKIDYQGTGTVERTLGIDIPFANFATGGLVPGKPVVSGDNAINDRILALLSPGEAIIPRSAMDNPAIAAIVQSILSGQLSVPRFFVGGEIMKKLGGGLNEVLDRLGVKDIWEVVRREVLGSLMKMFESNKFHTGGLVPGFANGGQVPSMLLPGEFVMNRNAVRSIGAPAMSAMNSGAQVVGDTNIDLRVDIKTTQPIDEAFFRSRLMPKIKEELKRTSLDGGFVVASSGVRT